MDVRQLRHFAAVADTLHFGRAAERLGMTQPPLSQSIQALERELGAALFTRTKRSVALTPFGERWLAPVRAALADLAELPEIARRLRDGAQGRLDISFVSTADYSILPTYVRRYAALYPEVEISLSESTSDVQIAALMEGQGHAGIIIPPAGGVLPPSLSYRRLVVEPLAVAVPESWIEEGRIAAGGPLDPRVVIDLPLIIFPRRVAPAFHDLVTGYYAAHGGVARVAQEAIQMQTIISLVSAGMGVALAPASLRNLARTGVRYVDLAGEAPMLETGIVWRTDDLTPTLARFLDVVLQSPAPGAGKTASPSVARAQNPLARLASSAYPTDMQTESASAGSPTPEDFDFLMSTRGWTLFPGAMAAADLAAMRADLDDLYERGREIQARNGVAANMEGTAHHLVGYDSSLDRMVDEFPLYDWVERFFAGKFILLNFGASLNPPGSRAYVARPHRDVRQFTRDVRMSLNMLIMLDDFTPETGGTLILNGSHLVEPIPAPDMFTRLADRVTGKAGDVILFDSQVVHSAGENRGDKRRRALTLCLGRPWLKPQIDFPRYLADDKQADLSPTARQLYGFNARVAASLDEYYQPPERWTFKADQK